MSQELLKLVVKHVSWGNPAIARAQWRAEAEAEFQKLPLKERLLLSLSMLQPRKRNEPGR